MTPAPWVGVPIVAALLVTSMALLSSRRCQRILGAEPARKALHVGVGLVTLVFPWLFTSAAPVLVLATMALGWFEAVRRCVLLRGRFGAVLQRVARPGRGESCFVAGTALTFVISGGDPLEFCLPMAVLTLADSAAALVGQAVARRRGGTPRQGKTLAGSAAFFGVALACGLVALPIGGWSAASACVMALLLASVTTALEAAAGHGFDNLLIPVAAASLLQLAPSVIGGPL